MIKIHDCVDKYEWASHIYYTGVTNKYITKCRLCPWWELSHPPYPTEYEIRYVEISFNKHMEQEHTGQYVIGVLSNE